MPLLTSPTLPISPKMKVPGTNTAIPAIAIQEILALQLAGEMTAAMLNTAERKYADIPMHANAKRLYPFWKICHQCDAPFMTHTREQAVRNKTCSSKCKAKLIGAKNSGPLPLTTRKGRTVNCAVCEKQVWKPEAWLRKVALPTCSRRCNGVLRGAEWRTHAHKGRGAWADVSEFNLKARMTGEANPAWKGGLTYRNRKGAYGSQSIKYVRCPAQFISMARRDGYVMAHRLIVALALGRVLIRAEVVHHRDHDATNNALANLMLFATNGQHKAFEHGATVAPLWCGLCCFTAPQREALACVCPPWISSR
jgi:endogenous inhibitor of DNA gyrase (YacG/DUF329 family)